MTELRNEYVSNANVASWGREYGFHERVNVASCVVPSEENVNRFAADCFEAYLGAVVLSSSQNVLVEFIAKLITPGLESVVGSTALNGNNVSSDRDALQRLHQKLMEEGKKLPKYETEEVGEKTKLSFVVKCILGGREVSRGEAKSKKEGKRKAAEHVLNKPAKFFTTLPDAEKP